MAWELLPVDYTDAIWSGLKRYAEVSNEDGTVSFQDVTVYTNKEKSFFGSIQANRMNEALNTIMSMLENGTNLYEAFQNYFALQKSLFESKANSEFSSFVAYTAALEQQGDEIIGNIKTDYRTEMDAYEAEQKKLFDMWFATIRGQLSQDVAGKLQNQIDVLDTKTDGFAPRNTLFSEDGKSIEETYGNKKIVTQFVSSNVIVEKLYVSGTLNLTKTITFSDDGMNIKEVVG